jgi:trk system potassium uptake protein
VPRDATVVAVLRGGHVIVPRGDTVLAAGDEVLALVTSQTENAMKEILVGVGAGPSSEPRNAPDGPS